MTKLKPCPFCGSEDVELRDGIAFAGAVYCKRCTADVVFHAGKHLFNDCDWKETTTDAWNRREWKP